MLTVTFPSGSSPVPPMHSQAQYGSRSSTYKKTFLKTEWDCSWQACRNSKQLMGGWVLHGGSVRLIKGQLSQGQEVWKVNCREGISFSEDRGTTLFLFPSGCASTEEPSSWFIPTHPVLQAGGRHFLLSCMAKSQPQVDRSICFLLACTQATKYY